MGRAEGMQGYSGRGETQLITAWCWLDANSCCCMRQSAPVDLLQLGQCHADVLRQRLPRARLHSQRHCRERGSHGQHGTRVQNRHGSQQHPLQIDALVPHRRSAREVVGKQAKSDCTPPPRRGNTMAATPVAVEAFVQSPNDVRTVHVQDTHASAHPAAYTSAAASTSCVAGAVALPQQNCMFFTWDLDAPKQTLTIRQVCPTLTEQSKVNSVSGLLP